MELQKDKRKKNDKDGTVKHKSSKTSIERKNQKNPQKK